MMGPRSKTFRTLLSLELTCWLACLSRSMNLLKYIKVEKVKKTKKKGKG
jgi:hypothetical protein